MNLEQALNVLREKIVMKPESWKLQIFDFLVSHQLSVSYIADTGRRPCNSAGLLACEICNRAGWRCWSECSCQVWDRKSLTLSWPHSYQLHWQCSICVGKFQKQGMYSLCTIFSNQCVYLQVTWTMSNTEAFTICVMYCTFLRLGLTLQYPCFMTMNIASIPDFLQIVI